MSTEVLVVGTEVLVVGTEVLVVGTEVLVVGMEVLVGDPSGSEVLVGPHHTSSTEQKYLFSILSNMVCIIYAIDIIKACALPSISRGVIRSIHNSAEGWKGKKKACTPLRKQSSASFIFVSYNPICKQ